MNILAGKEAATPSKFWSEKTKQEVKFLMPKRGNNIYKRKDGRWEGRYIVGRRADGSAIYHSLYDHTYAGIKEKLTQTRQERKRQTSVTSFGDIRLSAVAFDWLAAKSSHLKPGSIARYETIIRCHILPLLGDTAIKDLTAEKLSAAVWQLKKKQLAVKTLTDISVVLKAILKSAAAEHFCRSASFPLWIFLCRANVVLR